MDPSPLNTSGSLILGLLVFSPIVVIVGCGGWAGPGLPGAGVLGPPCSFIVFLLVLTRDAVSSISPGDGGSGVSGLGALDDSCVWSSASPKFDALIILSLRSISLSLSRGAAVLFYLLGAA